MIGLSRVAYYRNGVYSFPAIPMKSLLSSVLRVVWIPHQGVLYRGEVFRSIGLFDLSFKLISDYEHLFRAALAGVSVVRMPLMIAGCDMDGASSNWRAVFREVKHLRATSLQGAPRRYFYLHGFFFFWARFKTHFIKTISESRIGPIIRPLWVLSRRFSAFFRAWF